MQTQCARNQRAQLLKQHHIYIDNAIAAKAQEGPTRQGTIKKDYVFSKQHLKDPVQSLVHTMYSGSQHPTVTELEPKEQNR